MRRRVRLAITILAVFFAAIPTEGDAAEALFPCKPMDLVTAEARPSPPKDPRRIADLCGRLTAPALSCAERARVAQALAGVRSWRAVNALTEALLEPGDPNAIVPLRIACAESLRWVACRGDTSAVKALYEVLVDPYTVHTSGQAIAKSLLDARGAAEVLPEAMKQTIDRAIRGESKGRSDHAWSRVYSSLRSYHMVSRRRGQNPYTEALGLLAKEFRQSSDTRFVKLLDYLVKKRFRLSTVIGMHNAQGLLRSIIIGVSRRKPAAREALLRWLLESASGSALGRVSVQLDSVLVRELGKLLPQIGVTDRKRLLAVLDGTCHGRAADVVAGKLEVADLTFAAARKDLEAIRAGRSLSGLRPPRAITEGMPPVSPWRQLAFEAKQGMRHPYFDVLHLLEESPESINLLWYCRPGVPVWEILAEEHLDDLLNDRLAGMSLQEPGHVQAFTTLFALAMNLAPRTDRPGIAGRTIRRIEGAPADCQDAVLHAVSRWAFATADHRFPVQVAEWIVSQAERASRDGRSNRQSVFAFALGNLTPEGMNPDAGELSRMVGYRTFYTPEQATAYETESRKKFLQLQEKRVTAETAAIWRAWLERFRELPVFRTARAPRSP